MLSLDESIFTKINLHIFFYYPIKFSLYTTSLWIQVSKLLKYYLQASTSKIKHIYQGKVLIFVSSAFTQFSVIHSDLINEILKNGVLF